MKVTNQQLVSLIKEAVMQKLNEAERTTRSQYAVSQRAKAKDVAARTAGVTPEELSIIDEIEAELLELAKETNLRTGMPAQRIQKLKDLVAAAKQDARGASPSAAAAPTADPASATDNVTVPS